MRGKSETDRRFGEIYGPHFWVGETSLSTDTGGFVLAYLFDREDGRHVLTRRRAVSIVTALS
jgi:hypothetical protein